MLLKAKMVGAIVIPAARERECMLARRFGRVFQLALARFGSTDCGCHGHLFFSQRLIVRHPPLAQQMSERV